MNISREQYERLEGVNFSTLKAMARSPAHYRHLLTHGREDSDALKIGRAVHLAVYEPELFRETCVVWDDGPRRGKRWDAFRTKYAGCEILTAAEHERCVALATAVRLDAVAAKYVTHGRAEQTLQWTHTEEELGGVPGFSLKCKGRVDWVPAAGALVDLKTCRDASPDGFGRAAWSLSYCMQAAFYVDGHKAMTGEERPYVLVAAEKEAPYCVAVYRVPDIALELGREQYRALLRRLHECREANAWPGYATAEQDLTLPRWAVPFNEDENAEDMGLTFGQEAAS